MSKVFITGSSDGLGQLTAKLLISQGHRVVIHARNGERAKQAMLKVPGAEKVLTADLSIIEEVKNLAAAINATGSFDAIIHNAGVYRVSNQLIFAVNILAPYILTCMVQKPARLIYLSSGMHLHGHPNFENFINDTRNYSYSDSKLHVLMLSMAVARKWKDVYSNTVNPGWVPTKMGGHGAPDPLDKGVETQAWLAVSDDEQAKVNGRYFFHKREEHCRPEAKDEKLQERLLLGCEQICGIRFPGN